MYSNFFVPIESLSFNEDIKEDNLKMIPFKNSSLIEDEESNLELKLFEDFDQKYNLLKPVDNLDKQPILFKDGQDTFFESNKEILHVKVPYKDNSKFIPVINSSNPKSRSFKPIKSKQDYINLMYSPLCRSLLKYGLDYNKWVPTLIALTALESGWGKSKLAINNNNFGGIKGKGKVYTTTEMDKSGRYYKIKDSFKDYRTIQDFTDDYVRRLKTKFHAFDGEPSEFADNIKKHNYFTDSLSKYKTALRVTINNLPL